MARRVVVAGYYGFGNLGDEVLLRVVLRWLARFPELEPCVLSGNPEQTRRRFGVRAVSRSNAVSVVRALWGAGALVFGGGGLLQDATSRRSLTYYLSLLRLARAFGVPALLVGQGLGPLGARGRHRTAEALRRVSYLGVRDRASYELARDWGVEPVHLGVDWALCLTSPPPPAESGGPLLGLALVAPPEERREAVLDQLVTAVRAVEAEHALTPIFLANNPRDLSFGVALSQRLGSLTVLPLGHETPEDHLALLAGFTVVWASRLHALALATLAGVPFVALGYDPKIQHFVAQVNAHLTQPLPYRPLTQLDGPQLVRATGMLFQGRHDFGPALRQVAGTLGQVAQTAQTDAGDRLGRLLGLRPEPAPLTVEKSDASQSG